MSEETQAAGSDDSSHTPEEPELSGNASPTGDRELSRDDVFNMLRNQRRRAVLEYLRTVDDTSTLDELARHIAAEENDIELEQLSSQQRKRVYVSLYQNHLPKMDNVGLVSYDKDRGTVVLQDISLVTPYLSSKGDNDAGVSGHMYAALTAAVVVAVGLSGVGPMSTIPTTYWALTSELALVAVLVIEIYNRKRSFP